MKGSFSKPNLPEASFLPLCSCSSQPATVSASTGTSCCPSCFSAFVMELVMLFIMKMLQTFINKNSSKMKLLCTLYAWISKYFKMWACFFVGFCCCFCLVWLWVFFLVCLFSVFLQMSQWVRNSTQRRRLKWLGPGIAMSPLLCAKDKSKAAAGQTERNSKSKLIFRHSRNKYDQFLIYLGLLPILLLGTRFIIRS